MAARTRIPPPPVQSEDRSIWNNWYIAVKDAINNLRADLKWTNLDFTGSNITDVQSRSHQNLQNLQGGSSTERYHLTSTQATAIAAFNATQWTDLTDGGSTSLHHHGGLSVTITTAPVTGGGATGSMTFTNGVLTAHTPAT